MQMVPKTILVVDDEFYAAEILTFVLEDEGYRVLSAFNGRDGLEKIKRTGVDLIVLDVMMPIMNGAEMARALRADSALAAIPILVTSALPEPTIQGMFGHLDGFLRKPFQLKAAITAVRRLLHDDLPAPGATS